jgi:hypothetical protein
MSIEPSWPGPHCSLCGITDEEHRERYGVSLGLLSYSLDPGCGEEIEGQLHLCRLCTQEHLPLRLLQGERATAIT